MGILTHTNIYISAPESPEILTPIMKRLKQHLLPYRTVRIRTRTQKREPNDDYGTVCIVKK